MLGPGNIGTDLLIKLLASPSLDPVAVVGVDDSSDGLRVAREHGISASTDGVGWLAAHADEVDLVFDATSAAAHVASAPVLAAAGLRCVDLTPAKLGPGVVPVVNLDDHWGAQDIGLISCGGQATIPIVAAVAAVVAVPYAEIVATIASRSAGPGTRQNIDEFTRATARGIEEVGGAGRGKAIIILNPAEPPLVMRNTVFCAIPEDADEVKVEASIREMVTAVAAYVPGYRLAADPVFDRGRVTVSLEVEGAGDHLPSYAGNLDIMTAAAVRLAEGLVEAS